MSRCDKDGWRYQAVYSKNQNSLGGTYNAYTICEIYLDVNGKLKSWTENNAIPPSGETIEELIDDINLILEDVSKWKPVPFESLKVGMTFEQNL